MRLKVGIYSVAIGLLAGVGFASTPLDALNAASAEVIISDGLTLAEADLQRSLLGLSASLGVDPGISYEVEEVDADEPLGEPSFDFGYRVGLSVDYTYDRADILSQRIDLLQAKQAVERLRREAVESALLLHADLLRAQLALDNAQEDVVESEETLNQRQADEATQGELRAAELDLQKARLDLVKAQRRLAELAARFEPLGLSTPVSFSPLFFSLPDAILEEDLNYQRLKLALAKAQVEAQESTIFDVVEEVELSGGYFGGQVALSGDLNLTKGKPGAGLNATLREDDKQSWKVELSAKFGFDDQSLRRFSEANADLVAAEEALETFVESYVAVWEEERLDVEYAQEDLIISLESFQVDGLRVDELEASIPAIQGAIDELNSQLETLSERRDAAEGDERRTLDQQVRSLQASIRDTGRELQAVERDLSRLKSGRSRALDGLYRDWVAYVQAVGGYLEVVDGEWQMSN